MRVDSVLFALAAFVAGAAAQDPGRSLTKEEMVLALMSSPHLMPAKSYRMITELLGHSLRKRQTAPASPPPASSPPASSPPAKGKTLQEEITNGLNILSQLPGFVMTGSTSPPRENAPKATVPEIQTTQSPIWKEAKRVKVRYGPYRMPPSSERNLAYYMWSMEGSSSNIKLNVTKPCSQCTILRIHSELEYFDGKVADTSNDAVFHHSILFNTGLQIREATCGQPLLENIFMSGTEKSVSNYSIPDAKIKSGYKVSPSDNFILQTDLQNLSNQEKYVWQTVIFDLVDGNAPQYRPGQIVWMTIGSRENPSMGLCNLLPGEFPWGPSNLTSADIPKVEVFSEHSRIWRADRDGYILSAGGHLHAGGLNLLVLKNNVSFCDSIPRYAKSSKPAGHGHMRHRRQLMGGSGTNKDVAFIEYMAMCFYTDGIRLVKKDGIHIQANYDFKIHSGHKTANGVLDEVMGMAGVLIAFDNT